MEITHIYLIQSSKGFVSLYSDDMPENKNVLLLFLGPVSGMSCFARDYLNCNAIGIASELELRIYLRVFLKDSYLSSNFELVFTDSTFNHLAYLFWKRLSLRPRLLTLVDHLGVTNLSYQRGTRYFSVRNAALFLRFWKDFNFIEFSNGIRGYTLKIPFNNVIKLNTMVINNKYVKIPEMKVLLLVPISYENCDEFTCFLKEYKEKLDQFTNEMKLALFLKLHPREVIDLNILLNYFGLRSKNYIPNYIPLEFVDTSDVTIFNWNSSYLK